jgi:hypothetical protein
MTLACTESSRKESQAIERAKTLWLQSLKTEAAETISGKTSFRSSYADIMFEKSEFTVEPADPKQDANTVTVKVKSVPQPVRKVLMEIIAKMDELNAEADEEAKKEIGKYEAVFLDGELIIIEKE